jgi:hypothetical protein
MEPSKVDQILVGIGSALMGLGLYGIVFLVAGSQPEPIPAPSCDGPVRIIQI